MSSISNPRRLLRRSSSDRILGGVCAGLAHYFGTDPLLIRVVFVVIALAQGAGVLVYVLLWILMPEESVENAPAGAEGVKAGFEGVRHDLEQAAGRLREGPPYRQSAWLGGLLVLAGAYLLAVNAGLFRWWDWTVGGPVLLIVLGLYLVIRRLR